MVTRPAGRRRRLDPALAALAVLAWLLGAAAPGRGQPGGTAAAPADSSVTELPPDLLEAIGELDALDQPLPAVDLAAAAAPRRGEGRLRWRTAALATGLAHDGRLELDGGRFGARAAVRLRPDLPAAAAGGLHLRLGRCRLWAGHLVLRHGHGLANPDPARRASLAADQALGGVSGGLAPTTAAGQGGAGLQLGVECDAGRWRLAALAAPAAANRARALRLARGGPAGGWALLARQDTSGLAASWTGQAARSALAVHWEVAAGHRTGGPAQLAAVAGLAWQAAPGLRLELQSGLADRSLPGTAAVLPGGAGSGWALRLAWRNRAQGALELLLQSAQQTPAVTPLRRRRLDLAEVVWERRPAPGLVATLRVRHAARRETTWSERAPWEAGRTTPGATRTLLAAGLAWEGGDTRLAGQWRSFTVGADVGGGTRQLLSVGGRRPLGRGIAVSVDAATAWGDPVDLVRAAVPLPGLVVARHWGRWRSEVVAGLAAGRGPLALRLALARRLPEAAAGGDADPSAPSLEGWFEASAAW